MSYLTELRDRLEQLEQNKQQCIDSIKEIKRGKLVSMVGNYYKQTIDGTRSILYVRSCNNTAIVNVITLDGGKYAMYECEVSLNEDGTQLVAPMEIGKVLTNGIQIRFPTNPELSSAEEFISLLSEIIQMCSTDGNN